MFSIVDVMMDFTFGKIVFGLVRLAFLCNNFSIVFTFNLSLLLPAMEMYTRKSTLKSAKLCMI